MATVGVTGTLSSKEVNSHLFTAASNTFSYFLEYIQNSRATILGIVLLLSTSFTAQFRAGFLGFYEHCVTSRVPCHSPWEPAPFWWKLGEKTPWQSWIYNNGIYIKYYTVWSLCDFIGRSWYRYTHAQDVTRFIVTSLRTIVAFVTGDFIAIVYFVSECSSISHLHLCLYCFWKCFYLPLFIFWISQWCDSICRIVSLMLIHWD